MKLWLVIGSDEEGAWIDKDCVFELRSLAEAKAEKLRNEAKDDLIEFSVTDIDMPCKQDEAIAMVADSIRANADAMMSIAESVREFITCACSVDALGNTATHPSIIVKKGEN